MNAVIVANIPITILVTICTFVSSVRVCQFIVYLVREVN